MTDEPGDTVADVMGPRGRVLAAELARVHALADRLVGDSPQKDRLVHKLREARLYTPAAARAHYQDPC